MLEQPRDPLKENPELFPFAIIKNQQLDLVEGYLRKQMI